MTQEEPEQQLIFLKSSQEEPTWWVSEDDTNEREPPKLRLPGTWHYPVIYTQPPAFAKIALLADPGEDPLNSFSPDFQVTVCPVTSVVHWVQEVIYFSLV